MDPDQTVPYWSSLICVHTAGMNVKINLFKRIFEADDISTVDDLFSV